AWVSDDKWYGNRTTCSASTIAGDAARYPTRTPAKANALLMVRVTTSRGNRGSSVIALSVPGRANSAYASSTMTTPGAYDATASTVSRCNAVPVGLLGEQR